MNGRQRQIIVNFASKHRVREPVANVRGGGSGGGGRLGHFRILNQIYQNIFQKELKIESESNWVPECERVCFATLACDAMFRIEFLAPSKYFNGFSGQIALTENNVSIYFAFL